MPTTPANTYRHALTDGRLLEMTPARKAGVFTLALRSTDGALTWSDSGLDLFNSKERQRAAKESGLPEQWIIAALDQANGVNGPKSATGVGEPATPGASNDPCVSVRGIRSPASTAKPHFGKTPIEAMAGLLALDAAALPDEAFCFWDRGLDLRAVDVDWHGGAMGSRPDEAGAIRLIRRVRPTPAAYWITHGGGLRLIYAGLAPYTAEELATCAAALMLEIAPGCSVEIKCDTRHPASLRNGKAAGAVGEALQCDVLGIIGRFANRGCTDAERDAWLDGQGLEIGALHAHHHCPIDAHHVSQNAAPVFVGEDGVYCHSCAQRLGDGFRSYGRLTGSRTAIAASAIYEAARTFVHWPHAEYLFKALAGDVPRGLWRSIYSALLKYLHRGDRKPDRIARCFADFPYVRGSGGLWLHSDDLAPVAPRLGKEDVRACSWAQRWETNDDGETKLAADTARVLQLATDGRCDGLAPLVPTHGAPVYSVHNHSAHGPHGFYVEPNSKADAVRYLTQRDRMKQADAWAVFERTFPGFPRDYFSLIHVARGCAELGEGMLPMLYVHGPSGAGKTLTGQLEATLSGDDYREVGMVGADKLTEAIGEAALVASGVYLNEFAKLNRQLRGGLATTVLQLGRRLTFRKPYVGMVAVSIRSFFAFTDTELPHELRSSEQFGRRVAYVRLTAPAEGWLKGASLDRWMRDDPAHRHAADSIHSAIVDEYFPAGSTPAFLDLAGRLGFKTLERAFTESEEGDRRTDLAREFFRAVVTANGAESDRWGRGWVPTAFETDNAVTACARQLVGLAGEDAVNRETLAAVLEPIYGRWHRILDLREPARFEWKRNGSKLFIRFRSDDDARQGYRVNAELCRDEAPIPTTPLNSGELRYSPNTMSDTEVMELPNSNTLSNISEKVFNKEGEGYRDVARGNVGGLFSAEAADLDAATALLDAPCDNTGVQPEFSGVHRSYPALVLDVETRSRCDLSDAGAWAYAQHPSTECICLVARWGDRWIELGYVDPATNETPMVGYARHADMPADLFAAIPYLTIVAHNAEFEQAIWRHVLKWPEPKAWVDTMALAAANGMPLGLDGCGQFLGMGGKDDAGYKLMLELCKPDRTGELPRVTAEAMAALLVYNRRDVEITSAIVARYGINLPGGEDEVWRIHNAINRRGVYIDADLCVNALRLVGDLAADYGMAVERETGGAITRTDLRRKAHLRAWLGSRGLDLDDMKAATIEKALTKKRAEPLPADVSIVLEAAVAVGKSSVAKFEKALDGRSPSDGRLRGMFLYAGASTTGRWAGRGVQVQNLPKPAKGVDVRTAVDAVASGDFERVKAAGGGDAEKALVASVRPLIRAKPGHTLILADFAAIEARGVLWLAQDEKHLEWYRKADRDEGPEPYCLMASTIFGREVAKGRDKLEREVGKQAILGCGYQMGAPRFEEEMKRRGIVLGDAGTSAETVVGAYRAEFGSLASYGRDGQDEGLWSALNRAALHTVGTGQAARVGHVKFSKDSYGALVMHLPSGRTLRYHSALIRMESRKRKDGSTWESPGVVFTDYSTRKPTEVRTYGGMLAENATQATCRDLLAHCLVRCEALGLHPIMHVHDEIVCEVPEAEASASLDKLLSIMRNDPPEWAAGFPINAEGFATTRYAKEAI